VGACPLRRGLVETTPAGCCLLASDCDIVLPDRRAPASSASPPSRRSGTCLSSRPYRSLRDAGRPHERCPSVRARSGVVRPVGSARPVVSIDRRVERTVARSTNGRPESERPERYCQLGEAGARPAHRRCTSGLVKHRSPRSIQRRHEPAVFGGWLLAADGVRHGRDSG